MISKYVITMMLVCLGVMGTWTSVMAQENDSLVASIGQIAAGDTGYISVYLLNTQFSVGGFSFRLVLSDSTSATIINVTRGCDIGNFDYFNPITHSGNCKVMGIASMPNGHNLLPLPIGRHELAQVAISVAPGAVEGLVDYLLFQDDTLPPVRDNSISDSSGYIDIVPTLQAGNITIISEQSGISENGVLPLKTELLQNYPNPFNSETHLEFNLSASSQGASLDIYDLMGREIRNYEWGNLSAGLHGITWDGCNEFGQPVASGIYLYRLTTMGGASQILKMTFLK